MAGRLRVGTHTNSTQSLRGRQPLESVEVAPERGERAVTHGCTETVFDRILPIGRTSFRRISQRCSSMCRKDLFTWRRLDAFHV